MGDEISTNVTIPGYTQYSGLTDYTYDSLSGIGTRSQLVSESSTRNSGYTNNFAYDGGSYTDVSGVGNQTTMRGSSKSFNSDNQLSGTGFAYDGNGNPTTYNGTTVSYDLENDMTSYGDSMTARYNGDQLRAWKQDGSGSRTYFVYDGAFPLYEIDSSGTIIAVNTRGANGLLSRTTSGSSVFYTFDLQGNVIQRLDSSGSILSSHLFDSFGEGVSSTAVSDPSGFGAQWGYYTDSETGLILCSHRYYDPSIGHFLIRDPIQYTGGINLYDYTLNNSIDSADPLGYSICKITDLKMTQDCIFWKADVNNVVKGTRHKSKSAHEDDCAKCKCPPTNPCVYSMSISTVTNGYTNLTTQTVTSSLSGSCGGPALQWLQGQLGGLGTSIISSFLNTTGGHGKPGVRTDCTGSATYTLKTFVCPCPD
jgi:RHS repeat-associated protein